MVRIRRRLFRYFRATLKDLSIKARIFLSAAAVAFLGYLTPPIESYVVHMFYNEEMDIVTSISAREVMQGEKFGFDIFLVPGPHIGVGHGPLTVTYSRNIHLQSGQIKIAVLEFDKIQKPTEKDPIKFSCQRPGDFNIKVEYKTAYRKYAATVKGECVRSSIAMKPSYDNLSGIWEMTLGLDVGKMTVLDESKSVTGSYRLSSGERGTVIGVADGTTFNIALIREGNAVSRWFVKANFPEPNGQKPGYLEIKGIAELSIISNNEWAPAKPAKTKSFILSAGARN